MVFGGGGGGGSGARSGRMESNGETANCENEMRIYSSFGDFAQTTAGKEIDERPVAARFIPVVQNGPRKLLRTRMSKWSVKYIKYFGANECVENKVIGEKGRL